MNTSSGVHQPHQQTGALSDAAQGMDQVAADLLDLVLARLAGQTAELPKLIEALPCLQQLASRFGLSRFESELLLLVALVERDVRLAQAAARWHGDPALTHASLDFVGWLLPDAHRLALSPTGALRRWRLVDVAQGSAITRARLSVDERVQFYLDGHSFLDTRLEGLLRPLTVRPQGDPEVLGRIARALQGATSPSQCPLIAVTGSGAEQRAACVAAAGELLRMRIYTLSDVDIPAQVGEREALARLWEREAMLLDAALFIDCAPQHTDHQDHLAERLKGLLQTLEALAFVSSVDRPAPLNRPMVCCELTRRGDEDELQRWQGALGPLAHQLNGSVAAASAQFRLDDQGLRDAAAATRAAPDLASAGQVLWDSARVQARRGLQSLAERIDARAGWGDLVLPPAQMDMLRSIAVHVRERHRVYSQWGFADKSARGLGIAALFSGGSGTGKTLAAEVLSHELRLDLYRIDLSRLVSKYIGDTERNLARVFDAAEACGAIVLFDEADALFGKRSEVRDSHDRYANIEVSYLLQRIESYRGLSILTTNLKQALDPAFVRRIRFVVQFPFPDGQARQEIWSQVFPSAMPREALDMAKLSRLNIAGGHIRNIALNAAFMAASQNEPVRMAHLRSAAEAEYAKLEKPLSRAEVGDWA